MAIDANVLVFERAREEYAASPREGPARRAHDRLQEGVDARSSTPTSRRCSPPGCCSSSPPARSRASASRCRIGVLASMVSALVITRVLAELGVSTQARREAPRDHRHRRTSAGSASWLTAEQPRPDECARRVARRVAAVGARHRGRRHRRCAGSTSASSSPAGGCVEYSTSQPSRSTRRATAVAEAGFPRRSCRTRGDAPTSPCAPARSATTRRSEIQDGARRGRRGDGHQGARRADRRRASATSCARRR